ncbi:hypothetical protein BC829DRAFT_393888 [Chytridium lagenaria]|nr:hypothetical protein BC829DRAFT_393888 [Chytridium lagenaria]
MTAAIIPATKSTSLASYYEPLLDGGYLPDFVLRRGIRHLLSRRKSQLTHPSITIANDKFPNSSVTGLSNSNGQREYITRIAKEKGLKNITIITADINEFTFESGKNVIAILLLSFDRIVSIEILFKKVSSWLTPETGRLFVHVFAHANMPYDFKTEDDNSWMARNFFTGGTMPSQDLFLWFQDHLCVLNRWTVDGRNYGKTSEEWLKRLDAVKKDALPILAECYGGEEEGKMWFQRWRVFYMSEGQEWCVVHYLFKRQSGV